MGCDIHSRIEVKENGVWRANTDKIIPNSYYKSEKDLEEIRKQHPDYTLSDFQTEEFQEQSGDDRNYDWFALIGNVRNGYGFAGCVTGERFEPISSNRGLPDDATEEWKQYVEAWGCDMHSVSWLSLEDFLNYDMKNKFTIKTGIISLDDYKRLRNTNGCPNIWCGEVSGGNNVTVSEKEADKIINGKTIKYKEENYFGETTKEFKVNLTSDHTINVEYSWKVNYAEWFDWIWKEIVEPMKKLKEKYEDVRIVFGFDN